MARHRDERYENASIMAQDLRNLHLQAPATVTGKLRQLGPREGIVLRPPKRPQVQRPPYLEPEAARSPARETSDQLQGSPAPDPVLETPGNHDIGQVEDIPTGPLISEPPFSAEEQGSQSAEARRSFWKQVQRIFKTSS